MTEFVHLTGSEDVYRAGCLISQGAETMQRAASSISASVDKLTMAMDSFIYRLEEMKSKETT